MWVLLPLWCLTSFPKCLCMPKSVCIQESVFEDVKGVKATKELSSGGPWTRLRGMKYAADFNACFQVIRRKKVNDRNFQGKWIDKWKGRQYRETREFIWLMLCFLLQYYN